jgi:glycosyltransferase involved in cell wall biosynthesis
MDQAMTSAPTKVMGETPPRASLLLVTTVAATIHHFLLPYASHLRDHGWRVDAAANGAAQDSAIRETFDHVYDIPLSRSIHDVRGLVLGTRALDRALASEPDIVHVHTPIAAFMTRLAIRRLPAERRPALVYTVHGFHFHRGGRLATNALFLTAERLGGRWTDRLVVINDEDHEAARRNRIVPPDRLVRMPGIGIDTAFYSREKIEPSEFSRARHSLGVGPNAPLFVVVAELNRNKRPVDAVEALALMRHGESHLAFVGSGGDRSRVEALATSRGVGDRVHFAGFLADIRPLVAGATALVLPSRREGLARAVMEALALQVPVVASTARGNGQLVGDDSGFVVPTGDVAALAARMDWLIEHPVEANEMGRRGRARMVGQYELRNLILRHEQLYAELLASRTRAARRV